MSQLDLDADELLRADARRQGITDSEYERELGVALTGGPREQRIAHHEIPAGIISGSAAAPDIRRLNDRAPHIPRGPRSYIHLGTRRLIRKRTS